MKEDYSSRLKIQWSLYQLDQILELIWSGNRQKWFTICDEVFLFKKDLGVISVLTSG